MPHWCRLPGTDTLPWLFSFFCRTPPSDSVTPASPPLVAYTTCPLRALATITPLENQVPWHAPCIWRSEIPKPLNLTALHLESRTLPRQPHPEAGAQRTLEGVRW